MPGNLCRQPRRAAITLFAVSVLATPAAVHARNEPSEPPSPALPAAAVAEPQPSTLLTWAAVAAAATAHPALAAARAHLDAARGESRRTGAPDNPELTGRWGWARPAETEARPAPPSTGSTSAGNAGAEWGVDLALLLGWLFTRRPALAVARAGEAEALAEGHAARLALLAELRRLFWGVAGDQALGELLARHAQQTAELARLVGERAARGHARPGEALHAEIEREEARIELTRAHSEAENRREQLCLVLGWPTPDRAGLRVQADLGARPTLPPWSEVVRRVEEHHPLLAATRARLAGREAEAELERRRSWPQAALVGSYAQELDRVGGAVGLSLVVPLFSRNEGGISRAMAETEVERQRLAAIRRELLAVARTAYGQCQVGWETATRLEREVLPRAELAATLTKRTFQSGEASLLELLEAGRRLDGARRKLLAAQLDAQRDCAELAVLIGLGGDPERETP